LILSSTIAVGETPITIHDALKVQWTDRRRRRTRAPETDALSFVQAFKAAVHTPSSSTEQLYSVRYSSCLVSRSFFSEYRPLLTAGVEMGFAKVSLLFDCLRLFSERGSRDPVSSSFD